MGSLKKPEIQQSSGMSLDSCRVDLTNRCTSDSLFLRLRGEKGTKIVPRCTFYPKVDTTVSRQGFKADSSIASLSRDSLLLSDSTAWQNLKINPGGQIVSGVLEVLFDISGPAGTEQRKHRIDIKATEAEVYRGETSAKDINVELRYKSDATKYYEQVAPNLVRFRGPAGCKVYLNMSFDGQSCGHKHHVDSTNVKATGSFSMFKSNGESMFTLDGGRGGMSVDYTSYGVCGNVSVKARFVHPKYGQLAEKSFKILVRYPGTLIELEESDTIHLVGDNTWHPENHYGKPELVAALKSLAKAFVKACSDGEFNAYWPVNRVNISKFKKHPSDGRWGLTDLLNPGFVEPVQPEIWKLQVNDMSLVCGGRFDCCSNSRDNPAPFLAPHQLHMFGDHADIRAWEYSTKQNYWLSQNFGLHGLRGDREYEGQINRDHWHCTLLQL